MICCICSAQLQNNSEIYKTTGCKHTLHKQCLKFALESQMNQAQIHLTCPLESCKQ